jgi:nucleotide-binding universal stress UspA family protein
MSYRTILVHADSGSSAEKRVRLAARLAQRFGAGLVGAAVRLPAPLLEVYAGGAAMISAGMLDAGNAEIEKALKTAESDFQGWTTGLGLDTQWRSAVDFPAPAIARMATAADLVVIGGAEASVAQGGDRAFDPGDLIMKAGRPVLVVPPGLSELQDRHILFAWKNSHEARRALSDALPLLKDAATVTLLRVAENSEERSETGFADALAFLDGHAVAAKARSSPDAGLGAGEEIIAAAKRDEVGLIVCGAYGHSRLREWAFGGVTRELLARSPVPCLFSR